MKRLFYLLFCISLLSCGRSKPERPANLIPEEKMIRILADVHTVEAQVERTLVYPDTALMTFNHYQKEILDNHDVTQEEFRATYRYYLDNLDEMDRIYEVIVDTLSVRESKVQVKGNEQELQMQETP